MAEDNRNKTYKDEGLFQRLGKLFQGQIILRKTPTGQVKVKDVDFSQSSLTSNFIDRYNRVTADDIHRVLALYFQADNVVIYNLNPRHISVFDRVAYRFLDIFNE